VVATLLNCKDIDVNVQDDNQDTPLHEASLNGHHEIVQKLLEHMEMAHDGIEAFNPVNSELKTPLHFACHYGKIEVVQKLLAHVCYNEQNTSCLIETRDNESNTALHLACESGNGAVVSTLVRTGADLLALKQDDVSPMHIAARLGFNHIAEELMTRGAREDVVNRLDSGHQTPLHYAAAQNQVEMIKFLLEQ
jgi:ankyrin repeat protein